jgi:hypothetical protein
LTINENYKVETPDELNCVLYHRGTGNKSWRPVAYFTDPRDCIERMAKLEIFGTGLTDVKTVCKKFDELNNLIKTLEITPDVLQPAPRITKDGGRVNHRGEAAPVLAAGKYCPTKGGIFLLS